MAEGTYGPMWSSMAEVQSLAAVDVADCLDIIVHKRPSLKFLSVYGTKDNVIPLKDADLFQAKLGRRQPENGKDNSSDTEKGLHRRHELVFIDNADHNYFGKPRHAGEKRANYNPTVVKVISTWLQDRGVSHI